MLDGRRRRLCRALFIEQIFQLPGWATAGAVADRRRPPDVLASRSCEHRVVLVNLIVDLLYPLIDPRVRVRAASDSTTASRHSPPAPRSRQATEPAAQPHGELRLDACPAPARSLPAASSPPLGPTYDRYANLLSFGQDPRWRRFLVSRLDGRPRRHRARRRLRHRGRRARARAAEGLLRGRRRPEPGDARRGAPPARARSRNERVRLVEASAEELPFEDASFDGLTAAYLLRYLDDLPAGLRELARVAAAGRDGRAARLRRPAEPARTPRMGRLGRLRPPPRRPRDLARLARGRPLPRRQHPRIRRALAGTAAAHRPARGRLRGRRRRSASASAAAPSSGAGARDRSAAGVLRARPGRLARLRHAAAPALHGLAPELRRDRRLPRAAPLRGPARGRAASRSSSPSASRRTRWTS